MVLNKVDLCFLLRAWGIYLLALPSKVVSLLSSVSRGHVQLLLQLVGSFSIHLTGNRVGSCEDEQFGKLTFFPLLPQELLIRNSGKKQVKRERSLLACLLNYWVFFNCVTKHEGAQL